MLQAANFHRPFATSILGLALLTLSIGCGGEADQVDAELNVEEGEAVARIASGLSDCVGSEELFAGAFVDGSPVDDETRAKYRGFNFVADAATISGDTATIPVAIEDANEQIIANVEWTAVKEGDRWKLKTAPMP